MSIRINYNIQLVKINCPKSIRTGSNELSVRIFVGERTMPSMSKRSTGLNQG